MICELTPVLIKEKPACDYLLLSGNLLEVVNDPSLSQFLVSLLFNAVLYHSRDSHTNVALECTNL